ncbi:hypothetical protein TNCV_3525891 [Trichonephila clavipes]|nr:hypothetical protein TNCV_3525891 [Trichonephila clavipes]
MNARQLIPPQQRSFRLALQTNGQQCLNNSMTPSFSAWADAVKPCGDLGRSYPLLKIRMFLAEHPSQGCFGLESHCAP